MHFNSIHVLLLCNIHQHVLATHMSNLVDLLENKNRIVLKLCLNHYTVLKR
jgi:hypothetical protein